MKTEYFLRTSVILFFWNIFFKGFLGFLMYFIYHCFICRPLHSTVSEDAGIEPRTVATSALAVRRSDHTRFDLKGHFWNIHRKIYLNCNANPHTLGLAIVKYYIFCAKNNWVFSFSRDTVPLRGRLWREEFFQMSHHFADSFPHPHTIFLPSPLPAASPTPP